ncbi:MAG: Abi family protein [Lachnoclostridium sp.]|nr:Abi family protein [Lachnospira sp.]MCM1248256.1 Abi family protein [Lachnoclostridium sp.]MCM1535559.1 Abi family protein [Clostridium sp.]
MSETIGVNKPFLTYQEQIDKLKNDKKLQIEDEAYAITLLKRHSYFALISGYKRPFKRKDGTYQEHTSIEDIYALYSFDNALRNIMLCKILIVEKHIKSLISYSFCEEYGSLQQTYLDATKYNYIPENQAGINKLIVKLTTIASDPKDYPYIQYQKDTYHNIPLWVMMKALPMGSASKMYSYLPPKIQTKVSQEYPYINESELARMLDLLSRIRNVCAHNERLFDYNYQKGAIKDSYIHQVLNIPKKGLKYKIGKSDLFAVLISLKYLLDRDEFEDLIKQIQEQLDTLYSLSKHIHSEQMRKYMGFPINWRDIQRCAKAPSAGNAGE